MERSYGKLILIQEGGPEQEFDLAKASVSLGRGMTNDIVLNDGRVSRSHARLDCAAGGCTLVDLGSANGTRLNGNRVRALGCAPRRPDQPGQHPDCATRSARRTTSRRAA